MKYFTKTYLYRLITGKEYGFIFETVIYSIDNKFYFLKRVLKEVSAVKHNPMKDSLKNYLTKT